MLDLLQPLHPKLVHFPIALFVTALVLELMSLGMKKDVLHQCALILYVAAALFSPLVVWAGMMEEERLGLHHPVLETHEHFALTVMWGSLVSLPVFYFLYKKRPAWLRPVFVSFLMVAAVCVAIAVHYGGKLVYEYGVGTTLF